MSGRLRWSVEREVDFLEAHSVLMSGLIYELVFIVIPVESLIYEHQEEYYDTLQQSTDKAKTSASDQQRDAVEQCFIQEAEVLEYYVTPMVDAWHDNYDDEEIQWVNKEKA